MKSRTRNKLMVSIVSALAPACALGVIAGIVITNWPKEQTLQNIVDKMNAKLASQTKATTMKEALELTKSICDAETKVLEQGEFVWDQEVNQFAIVDFSTTAPTVLVKTEGYSLNANNWRTWRMITSDSFDSYSQYSQYLKTSNAVTDGVYSSISGFDCGNNENVKNVHYFYEKMDTQVAKDIIINTCSKKTNVDISAWVGTDTGDTVTHYGKMCELTVVTNKQYIENGTAISATVYDGKIKIDANANIAMTYVRDAGVTLTDYKTSGTIDEIYAETDAIKAAIQTQVPQATIIVQDASTYQTTKETKISSEGGEVQHVFTVTGTGVQNEYYETLTDIANASNATNSPESFEGKTITLNKDYDMSVESANWVSISKYTDNYDYEFKGTFDGNNHSILNFNSSSSWTSLFGVTNGIIKNINFRNCNRNCTNGGGNPLLACLVDGGAKIENIHAYNCSVRCTGSSGLLISHAAYGHYTSKVTISNCTTDADCIAYNSSGNQMGGIVGQVCWLDNIAFENCVNEAAVFAKNAVGGIVGQYGSKQNLGSFTNCVNKGKIVILGATASAAYSGGLIGYLNSGSATSPAITITDCKNSGTVTSFDTTGKAICGGFIGYTNAFTTTFTRCKNSGIIGLIKDYEESYTCAKAAGFIASNNGDVKEAFIDCENAGTIHSPSAVGHFGALATSTTTYEFSGTATICYGTLVDDNRVKLPGEPDNLI